MTASSETPGGRGTNGPDHPAWLDRQEYPFASHTFEVPAGTMHYVDEGQGDPIVLVHGNPGWSFEYRQIIKAMSPTNRVIAVDHLGFGLSDKPPNWDYRPASHADNLARLLDSLDLTKSSGRGLPAATPITLVVNDWGGPIGLSYAIDHPDKIQRLVILNTWMWSVADDRYYRMFSAMMGGPVGRFMIANFNIFGRWVVPRSMGDRSTLPKHIHRHYYQHLETKADRKGSYTFPREIIASSDWLADLWRQRGSISSIPTTIIWGTKDIAFRDQELTMWVENWNDPEVITLDDVGHFPQEEAPEVVVDVLKRTSGQT